MKYFIWILFLITNVILAQNPHNLEDLLDFSDVETSDAELEQNWELLKFYSKHPIDLNNTNRDELGDLIFLSSLQIENILKHITLHKGVQNKYELLAIPGMSDKDARRLSRFVRFGNEQILKPKKQSFKNRLFKGSNEIYLRTRYVNTGQEVLSQENFAPNLYTSYFYKSPSKLQYGLVLENDVGEAIYSEKKLNGYDFLSFHYYMEDVSNVFNVLAVGDYKINMGQGLIMKSGFRNGKSAMVNNVASVGRTIKPFRSVNEFNFLRGAASKFTLNNNFNLVLFGSYKGVDATIKYDSLDQLDYVRSIRVSGLHRTESEIAAKNAINLTMGGGVLSFKKRALVLDLNILSSHSSIPILTNRFFKGKYITSQTFVSLSHRYTFRSFHFFGESSIDNKAHGALIEGVMWSPDKKINISLVGRRILPGYYSLWSNAFTSGSGSKDEKGIYFGAEFSLYPKFILKGYFDVWKRTVPSHNRDLPTSGNSSFLRLAYKKRKHYELYIQSRFVNKTIVNVKPKRVRLDKLKQVNTRIHVGYKLNKSWEWRTRAEWTKVYNEDNSAIGFLWYHDVIYKPLMKRLSLTGRWAIFDTDGYIARIYAYENDQLNVFRVPFYSGSGMKWYLNLRYKFYKNNVAELRFAQTYIEGQKVKPELGLQLKFKW